MADQTRRDLPVFVRRLHAALIVALVALLGSCSNGKGSTSAQCAPYCAHVVALCNPVNGMTDSSCLTQCDLRVAASTSESVAATLVCVSSANDCATGMACENHLEPQGDRPEDVAGAPTSTDAFSAPDALPVPDALPMPDALPGPDALPAPDATTDLSGPSRELRFLWEPSAPLTVARGGSAGIALELLDLPSREGAAGVAITLHLEALDGGDGGLGASMYMTDGSGRCQVQFSAGRTGPSSYGLRASAPLAPPVELSIEVE